MKYRVQYNSDQNYRVEESHAHEYVDDEWITVFTGSIADCEAYIRLKEGGYL